MAGQLVTTHAVRVRGRGLVAVVHGPGVGLGVAAVVEQRRGGVAVRQFPVRDVEYFADGSGRNWTENWGLVITSRAVPLEDLVAGDTLHVLVPAIPDALPRPRPQGGEPLGL